MKTTLADKTAPRWLYEALRQLETQIRDVGQQINVVNRGEAPALGGLPIPTFSGNAIIVNGTSPTVANHFRSSAGVSRILGLNLDGFPDNTIRILTIGNWNGTVVAPSGTGTSGDILQSQGSSQPSWVTLGTTATSASFRDDVFRVYAVGDATKKVALDVSAVTTATTRTWTVPNVSGTVLLTTSVNAQRIGTATQTGNADDIAISGRVTIGTAAFTANQSLTISQPITLLSGTINQVRITPSVTASGNSTATYRALLVQVTGGSSITGGTCNFQGASIVVSPVFGSGASATEVIGLDMSATASVAGGTDTIGELSGLRGAARGQTTSPGDRFTNTSINGVSSKVSAKASNTQELNGVKISMDSSNTQTGVATRACGLNLDTFGVTGQFASGTCTGNIVNTSNVVNAVTNITSWVTGQYITGAGIPVDTFITGINVGGTQLTLSNNATANTTGVVLTIAGSITYWSGIYRSFAAVANMRNSRFLDNQSPMQSQLVGPLYLNPAAPGTYPPATAYLHIGAGVAAAGGAPIKLTGGVILTAPEAGAIEWTGAELTITDAIPTRKYILATDGINGAGAGAGTLLNAPAAGNPTTWLPVVVNGVVKYIPAW